VKKILVLLCAVFLILSPGYSQAVKEADVRKAVDRWTEKSPHFKRKKTPFVQETYRIKNLDKKTLGAGSMPFYVVELEPEGFLIMNSDKRLPPVLAYSDTGSLNLDDVPWNTFRVLLKGTMERNARKLMNIASAADMPDLLQPLKEAQSSAEWEQLVDPEAAPVEPPLYGTGGVTNGPFLTTIWNQCNHYNELCPADPLASAYYDGRAPAGCVAVVGAQIMNYYEWPYRGSGGHSYTDSAGSITGAHSVVFSDTYDWAHMQDDYYAWGSEPSNAVAAVSELMYEIGVAVEMDYENDGSSSSSSDLKTMMNRAFLYEKGTYLYSPADPDAVADQIRADMLADRPAGVSISGHAIVADGHVDDGANEYFHINYGWGGYNNGWYLVDSIDGDPAVGCVSGLYPAMMPVNVTESGLTNDSPDVALQWTVADVRTAEVQSVSVLRRVLQSSTFDDPADDFSNFSETSTDDDYAWVVTSTGHVGNCFFKHPYAYSNHEYHLTSIEKFVPGAGTALGFRLKARLGTAVFRVMISDDDGQSWNPEYSLTSYYGTLSWQWVSVDLSSYSGSGILIRFEYVPGSYYSSGGVWVDSISYTGGSWYDWETLQSFTSVTGGTVTNLSTGTNTLAFQAYDGSEWGSRSPSFDVIVEAVDPDVDGDGLPNDWEAQYFGGPTNANPSATCANGLNSVMEAYIAGLNPTNAGSFFAVSSSEPGPSGFVVNWSSVSGRVYSVFGTTNLVSASFEPLKTNILWPQSSWTDTVERAENFYRIDVQLAP
jgi:hypothetical protein